MDAGSWLITILVFSAIAWGIGRIFITRDTPAGQSSSPNMGRILFGLGVLALLVLAYKGCEGFRGPSYEELDDSYYPSRP
jgi:hypothetical protein